MNSKMDVTDNVVPPGGSLEVVISFDTTGSMCSWLDELRGPAQALIQRLPADIPGIRMAVFAHGDYCDKMVYVTKWIDFTGYVVKLCDFVKNVERTGGGDAPECYELVLRHARAKLSWIIGPRRVLIMIGDNVPHEPGETCNKNHIDCLAEVKALREAAFTIYGVQCEQYGGAGMFYEAISMTSGGKHLQLAEFDSLFHTLMAVCYSEVNDMAMLASYEKEVRARCACNRIAADFDAIFTNLRNDSMDMSAPSLSKSVKSLTPFSAGRTVTSAKLRTPVSVKMSLPKHVKMAAGRKTRNYKTPPKMKPTFDKFKESNLPLLKRENVPENNFNLRSLRWSPWTLAMACSGDRPEHILQRWQRRYNRPGYRLKMLPLPKSFSAKARGMPALFEVAVQGRDTFKKRYAVFSAFSSRSLGTRNWEQRLLGVARSQVDLVVDAGGRVYVRFCSLTSKSQLETSRRNIRRYDYAWRKVRRSRTGSRALEKGSLIVSRSDD